MPVNDAIGKRMKDFYESRSQSKLTRRTPVIVRIDGKSFHTFCKRFKKPYDKVLNCSLNKVMQGLCENIQGAKFAERHSDEISILITDYDTISTDAFFDYEIQKICSITASMATAEFCNILVQEEIKRIESYSKVVNSEEELKKRTEFQEEFSRPYLSHDERWPTFDSRCFNIPESEIENYFWWRMLDAKRGSINMFAQSNFSHKELQGLSCDQMQEKLWQEKGLNWGTLPQGQKIGYICKKVISEKKIEVGPKSGQTTFRSSWVVEGSPSSRTELSKIMGSIELTKKEEE